MVHGWMHTFCRGVPLSAVVMLAACGAEVEPEGDKPPGAEESAKTEVLESGAAALQTDAPLEPMNVYIMGFHPMKEEPAHQMEAHHFCHQVNEDFAQCALFDGNTRDARLNGIEYIISEKLFDSLPEEEKQYWHPHNYEILSGQLVGPGLPDAAEKELMEGKINSYGKTWHVWDTPSADREGDELPFGEAKLAWSLNRDGEAAPGLVERRDERMDIDSAEKRRQREDLIPLANPQSGVDALKDQFGRKTEPVPGVIDKRAAAAEQNGQGDQLQPAPEQQQPSEQESQQQ